jgi:hypothetical protein
MQQSGEDCCLWGPIVPLNTLGKARVATHISENYLLRRSTTSQLENALVDLKLHTKEIRTAFKISLVRD